MQGLLWAAIVYCIGTQPCHKDESLLLAFPSRKECFTYSHDYNVSPGHRDMHLRSRCVSMHPVGFVWSLSPQQPTPAGGWTVN